MITVYSKSTCPHCDQAKQLLDEYGFDYTEVNIEQNTEANDFIVNEGHRSVPQLYIANTLLVEGGFSTLARLPRELIESRVRELS